MHVGKIGVDAAGNVHCDSVDDVPVKGFGILGNGDGVHVGNEEERLIIVLVVDDLAYAARIISYRKSAAGLQSRKKSFHIYSLHIKNKDNIIL